MIPIEITANCTTVTRCIIRKRGTKGTGMKYLGKIPNDDFET